jgi:UDP-glucose 4-epimerase
MQVLVIGGAGYIGSHMIKQLSISGIDVVTLDNLSCGYRDAVKYGKFIEGDLGERHDPESHLIPLIMQAASDRRADTKIFGNE